MAINRFTKDEKPIDSNAVALFDKVTCTSPLNSLEKWSLYKSRTFYSKYTFSQNDAMCKGNST